MTLLEMSFIIFFLISGLREIANTLLKYYPFDASDKQDPLPDLLLERMSTDSTIISDRITGSDVEHTTLAKSYISFLRSTAQEIVRYDEKFNEVLLYLESEFEAAIFIFDQEDEVKELARTLKQQTRIKHFFLHYFAGCSEIRVPHINAAFREIKASGGLTPPSRLKQLFAKFFSRNNPTTESPLIKAYKEWAEQNPYS